MLDKNRLPAIHIEALEAILTSSNWPIILLYINDMARGIQEDLLRADIDNANIHYLKGKADGAAELARSVEDFKDYFRGEYMSGKK